MPQPDEVSTTCGSGWVFRKLEHRMTTSADPPATAGGTDLILGAFMIPYLEKDGTLTFKVRVVPRASRSEVVGEHDGALRIRIAAPPVDGAANEELIRTLASTFSVPRSAIEIVAGHSSKLKTVRVIGLYPATLMSSLAKIKNDPRNATKYH